MVTFIQQKMIDRGAMIYMADKAKGEKPTPTPAVPRVVTTKTSWWEDTVGQPDDDPGVVGGWTPSTGSGLRHS